uniref:hypothetical protein n=1 Tax=Flavobacterium sp. TaxID=239 RepID=UPI00404B4EC7
MLGINIQEVAMHFNRNLNYITKQIDCLIFYQDENLKLLLTAQGFRKLFPKLITQEENAPKLSRITLIIFIKPITNKERYLKKEDGYISIFKQELKINDLYLQLDNYNTTTKKIGITVFHPYKDSEKMQNAKLFITMYVIGEIAFKKHLKNIEIKTITNNSKRLLQLIEIYEFINYLYTLRAYKRIKL